MARPKNEPIPGSEELYVALGADHVFNGMVLGEFIDMQGQSCNRQLYCARPDDVMKVANDAVGFASVTPNEFPPALQREGSDPLYFNADDLPTDENYAHAEIRVHRKGAFYGSPKSATVKTQLRDLLAKRFRVLKHPSLE